jgi:acetyl esterase/lipase
LILAINKPFRKTSLPDHVVYTLPEMDSVLLASELIYYNDLKLDIYYPPTYNFDAKLPIVILAHGYQDIVEDLDKDLPQHIDWAKLIAASGMIAVLAQAGNAPEENSYRVFDYLSANADFLGLDITRTGFWACSAGTPLALKNIRTRLGVTPAAFVAYYGIMPTPDGYQAAAFESSSKEWGLSLPDYRDGESYPADLQVLVVRAGRDDSVLLNSIDHFTAFAFQQNLAVTVINYPEGQHFFDGLDDTEETHAIIKQTLDFFRAHLGD